MSSKGLWQRARQTYASFVDDLLESSIELQRVSGKSGAPSSKMRRRRTT